MIQPCEFEPRIAAAVRTGHWSEELRAHAAGCEQCGETMLVAGALLASAMEPVAVPEAGLVWWKTQLRLRHEAAERVTRPMRVFDRVASFAGLGAAVWGVSWLSSESAHMAAFAGLGVLLLVAAAGSVYWVASSRR